MSVYADEQITVLRGLEAVRRRPGLYVGELGQCGVNRLVCELMDNAADEAREGYASHIRVVARDDFSVSVEDDGRGITIERMPDEDNKTALEVVFTTLFACNCGCDEPSGHRRGVHGLGVSVVCALSEWLRVETVRDETLYAMRFAAGKALGPLENHGPTTRRGTRVAFLPDASVLGGRFAVDMDKLQAHGAALMTEIDGLVVDIRPPALGQGDEDPGRA